jgi:hypothetical protein
MTDGATHADDVISSSDSIETRRVISVMHDGAENA